MHTAIIFKLTILEINHVVQLQLQSGFNMKCFVLMVLVDQEEMQDPKLVWLSFKGRGFISPLTNDSNFNCAQDCICHNIALRYVQCTYICCELGY